MIARRRVRLALALAVAIALVGCGSSDAQSQWNAGGYEWPPVIDPVTVAEGDTWRFDVGIVPRDTEVETYDTGERPAPCLQLVVADRPFGCIEVEPGGGIHGFDATARVGGDRFIWRASTIADEGQAIDHFIVWSSASPDGRRLDPIVYRDVVSLLWIMEPSEAPWGYQVIAPDGTLIHHITHVGLPAE